ncbi:MAG: hypothetical protein GX937_08750 [Lentisphaerae bacterium]|nr:hypothetical protein [Lentisphaerota bacterium]
MRIAKIKLRLVMLNFFLKKIKNTFFIAALLHDCAHSPFSHTGEDITKTHCNDIVKNKIKTFFKNTDFPKDLDSAENYPSIHELASAYVGARYFKQKFKTHSVDAEQFARMITGVKNIVKTKDNYEAKIYNFLIPLINGFIIDVDRLDYLLRDTWASGVSNARVDMIRLLNGIKLNWDTGDIEIKNQSLSSLINAVKARDFIYQWILPHHKVAYFNHILHDAMLKLMTSMAPKYEEDINDIEKAAKVAEQIFSPERFFTPFYIGDDRIFMPTDGDIIYLIKKYDNIIKKHGRFKSAEQVLTRKGHLEPLWKSVPEFASLFPPPSPPTGASKESHKKFYNSLWGAIQKKTKETLSPEHNFLVLEPKKIKKIEHALQDINISIENSTIGLEKINLKCVLPQTDVYDLYYFFVYVPPDAPKKKLLERYKEIYSNLVKEMTDAANPHPLY